MKKIALHWQILIAFILAILVGIFLKDYVIYFSWMGDIFLRLLKMIVIPLILSSIISGVANMGSDSNFSRLGLKTLAYYLTTTVLAIIVGLLLVNLIKPGVGMDISSIPVHESININKQSISDLLIQIVPQNIFYSMANNEFLSVIFFAIIAGIFIGRIDTKYKVTLTDFFNASFELFMKMTMLIIKLAPFGIFGLIVKVVAEQNDFGNMVIKLGSFMLTVIAAILIHALITLPLLTKIIGKAKPFKHLNNVKTTLITAFSTASSAAALPLNMKETHEKSGVSYKITNFTLPLGATVNMDGTSIYIAAVVMFIAQAKGVDMGLKEQIILLIIAVFSSIGTAAVPMASLVMITIILEVLGLPIEYMALILPIDRILDMFRTATNVWSDSCGAVIIAKSEGEILNV
ncbi:MAG: sodium:dicarboxylate symporter [Bacteroidetes bacterium GWF2_33_16]|nr:MAG: sodium:dicarboxylate symporter [Bacteroidetes bacterium GWE2_32_14]OFY07056.1 MAG: sodium:dicarboxylate symporter [Bacteroidetes bacterium GWF2_33_16]